MTGSTFLSPLFCAWVRDVFGSHCILEMNLINGYFYLINVEYVFWIGHEMLKHLKLWANLFARPRGQDSRLLRRYTG